MVQPSDGPVTRDAVKEDLHIDGDADDGAVDRVVAAVNAFVRGLPVAQLPDGLVGDVWPAQVSLGAHMLAARLFRRRNTPSGVETFGDGFAYTRRNDPDVAMLLNLGEHMLPGVG